MEQTGSQVGPYRLYERIGGGGFASVFVARDTRTNEMVAVKVLHAHLAQDAQFIARFRREAEALQKMPPHPNIVRLREFGQQGSTYYLAMEYLEGKDLSQILAEHRRLPVDEALSIATQIAQALDMANRYGLVHRDIKPGNVKITPQGVVKVMDFGIARATEGTKLTQSGTFMGTPDYMAPEIWEGKPADIRSDIYALGAILYEMLTGASPFHSDTPAAIMRRHLMEQPRPVRAARADVPPNVDAVIVRMMAKDPAARYQTPGEVVIALQNKTTDDEPTWVVPRPVTPPTEPRPFVPQPHKRSSAVWVFVGVGGALVLLFLVIAIALVSEGAKQNVALATATSAPVVAPPTFAPTHTPLPTPTARVIVVTATPVPPTNTPIPGAVVVPLDRLARANPWLPLDKNAEPDTSYCAFNVNKSPFNSKAVRQAFAAAVDRRVIADLANKLGVKNARPATTFTPPETLGRDLYGQVGVSFDPARARALLTQAGYPNGQGFPSATLVTNKGGANVQIANAIAAMWRENLNVDARVEVVDDWQAYLDRLGKDAPPIFRLGLVADFNDPDNFLKGVFHSGAEPNFGHFSNPEFDRLVDQAAGMSDPAARQLLYIQAERILCEDQAAVIPVFHRTYQEQ